MGKIVDSNNDLGRKYALEPIGGMPATRAVFNDVKTDAV